MPTIAKREAARRDLVEHFIFLAEAPGWMWRTSS